LPKGTTSELAILSSHCFFNTPTEGQTGKMRILSFLSLFGLARPDAELEKWTLPTNYETDTRTTRPCFYSTFFLRPLRFSLDHLHKQQTSHLFITGTISYLLKFNTKASLSELTLKTH